jgi:beta-galactosidase
MSLRPGASRAAGGAEPVSVAIPCVGHEVGQWCAYPDFDVIEKFAGTGKYAAYPDGLGWGKTPYMVPGNYRIWRDSAEAHGLLAKNKELAHASGRLQVACYKEEIEANLRTPSYSGIELLDLHDYLGQGGALIGLLDAFWESKGYATPEEFRQFNNETVPLARLKDRVFTTADTLKADLEIAHYGARPLEKATARWEIVNEGGKVVADGNLGTKTIPLGKNISLGSVSAELSRLPAPARYKLAVEVDGGRAFRNEWNFWVYPAKVDAAGSHVLVTSSWPDAETELARGGKVLFQPAAADLDSSDPKASTVPMFWNHLMNPNGTTWLGMWNDAYGVALRLAVGGFTAWDARTECGCSAAWVAADCAAD